MARLKNVEVVLYTKPLCPFCAMLKDLVLKDLLKDRLIAERIPFYEVSLTDPLRLWNPLRRISEERRGNVIDLRTGREIKVKNRDWSDVKDYAHLPVSTPMLEIRIYTDRRVDRIIFRGFLPFEMNPAEYQKRVIYFKENLRGLLRSLAKML